MKKNETKKQNTRIGFNKKLIVSCLVGFLIIAFISLTFFIFISFKNKNNTYVVNCYFDPEESKTLSGCKNEDECYAIPDTVYDFLHLKNDYPELNKKVDAINKRTLYLYDRASKAKTDDDPECVNARDSYIYRYIDYTNFATFENDKYVSVMVERSFSDVCLNINAQQDDEVYIYDIKKKKIISQEEFIKELDIKDEEVEAAIKKDIDFIKTNFNEEYSLDPNSKKMFYYDYYGNLKVSYRFLESGLKYNSLVRGSDLPVTTGLEQEFNNNK